MLLAALRQVFPLSRDAFICGMLIIEVGCAQVSNSQSLGPLDALTVAPLA